MNRDNIANKLRVLRGNRTQAEVAEAVGISASAYGMYEAGQRLPRDDVKIRLAAYHGCSVHTIFFDDCTHLKLEKVSANDAGDQAANDKRG